MKHYLNDIEITPRNRTSIGITSNFTDNPNILELTTDSIILPREAFNMVKDHITNLGLFEGIPYRIELEGGVNLEYYVDLTDEIKVKDYEAEVTIKKRKGLDNFRERAEAVTFTLMKSKGVSFDLFNVPYLVIPENQIELAITLGISTYVMTESLIKAGQEAYNSISELIQAVTPSVGAGIVMDTGDIIVLVLKVVARVIIFALILVAVIDLATKLFTLIFPPKRNLKACKVQELLKKGCQYLGYTFVSDLLTTYPNYTILPVPLVPDRRSIFDFRPEEWITPYNNGVPASSDSVPTLGLLFDAVETMFNARTRVFNGVVRLERRDYWATQASAQILPALTDQNDRLDEFSYNTEDVWKRYYIKYNLDYSDIYTLDGNVYDIHDAEYSTEPTSIVNADLVSIKGLNEVNIPFSLGKRKETLNWLEKIAKTFFELVDSVTGIFGGGTNFGATIQDRTNLLVVSQMYFSTTKILWTIGGRQPASYANYISATNLWNKYHYINKIDLNAWTIKENARLRLKATDFVTLLNNNFAQIDGEICEITEITYIDEASNCEVSYKTPSNYATGKVNTIKIN
jgi:hypothetical protein